MTVLKAKRLLRDSSWKTFVDVAVAVADSTLFCMRYQSLHLF
jgi:hypothetical protein